MNSPRIRRFTPLIRAGRVLLVLALFASAAAFTNGQPNLVRAATITNPGGVTGAAFWVKADTGVQANASAQVEQWLDQSGSGNTTTELRASSPAHTDSIVASDDILQVNNAINFNPAVDFSGATGKSLKADAGSDWNTPMSIFAVSVAEGTQAGGFGGIWTANANWTVSGVGAVGLVALPDSYALDGSGCLPAASTSPITETRVVRATYTDGTSTDGGSTWLNGSQEGTISGGCATDATHFFEVGGRTSGDASLDNRIFNGKIAEVVVYKSDLASADDDKVETYLAVKYGVTLGHAYVNSSDTTIYTSTTYTNDITGIGRDDTSGLNQKQSKNVNNAALLTIGLGAIATSNISNTNAFVANQNFEIIGDDNGATTLATAIAGQPSGQRMARIWHVQETGTVGSVQLRIPATMIALSAGQNAYLIRSADATFDSTDTFLPLPVSGANYDASVDLHNGEFFTFAALSAPPAAPTITPPASGSYAAKPVFNGTTDISTTVTVTIDPDNNPATANNIVYTVSSDATGAWTLDTATATPVSGTLTAQGFPSKTLIGVTAIARDLAGTPSAPTQRVVRIGFFTYFPLTINI